MSNPTFVAWPKTPRWHSRLVVTEKIDGSNACVSIRARGPRVECDIGGGPDPFVLATVAVELPSAGSTPHDVRAGSRSRWLGVGKSQDNFGFARWVQDNANALALILGPGDHWGEYFGAGIQRTYGLKGKHFAVFNTQRFNTERTDIVAVGAPGWEMALVNVVPVLYEGESLECIRTEFDVLRHTGSRVNGWQKPEGVCIYQCNSRQVFKLTYEHEIGKWAKQDIANSASDPSVTDPLRAAGVLP